MNLKKTVNVLMSLILSALVSFPSLGFAQTAASPASKNNLPIIPVAPTCDQFYDSVNNFDFYPKNIAVSAVPGQKFLIRGAIENAGPYSIENASIYLAIREGKLNSTSTPAVEYVQLAKDVSLPIKGKESLSYDWQVPTTMEKGTYHFELSIVSGNKIVLPISKGLSEFTVQGKNIAPISLISSKLSDTNGKAFIALAFKNQTNEDRMVPVTIKTYAGRSLTEEPVDSTSKNVLLKKGTTSNVSIQISDLKFPNKVIVIQYAPDFGQKKLALIPVTQPGISLPELKVGGLSKDSFGVEAFACINPMNFSDITKTKTVISVAGKDGAVVKEFSKEYIATSTLEAASVKLESDDLNKLAGYAKVTISLYQGLTLADQSSFEYTCDSKGMGVLCGSSGTSKVVSFFSKYKNILVSILVVAVTLLLIGFAVIKKMKKSSLSVLAVIFALSISFLPNVTHAQTTWQDNLKSLIYNSNYNSDYPPTTIYPILGDLTATWFNSIFNDDPQPCYAGSGCSHNGSFGQHGGVTTTTGNIGSAYGGIRSLSYPLWYGFYIISNNVHPQDYSGNYSLYFRNDNDHQWAENLRGVSNAESDVSWEVPVGTRIGFYVSPKQSLFTNNNYFSWINPGAFQDNHLGEYLSTLPAQLPSCVDDVNSNANSFSYYLTGSSGVIIGRNATTCNHADNTAGVRNTAIRLTTPSVSITGLDNFSCEPLQADGTMECQAVSVGTSTPTITTGATGRVYGATTYNNYLSGTSVLVGYCPDCKEYYEGHTNDDPAWTFPKLIQSDLVQQDTVPISVAAPNPDYMSYYYGNGSNTNLVESVAPATLGDGQPGFTVPDISIHPFGSIVVVPQTFAPTAPVVTEVATPWMGANPYYGGAAKNYVFQAISTDSDSNDGIIYNADWDNDSVADAPEVNYQSGIYSTEDNPNNNQPGYSNSTGMGQNGDSLFDWDPYGEYQLSGSPIRFNGYFSTPGTTTIQVQAQDHYGNTSDWTPYTFKVAVPPDAPQNVIASTSASCDGGVRITWDSEQNVDGFRIYRHNNETGNDDLIATTSATSTSFDDTAVKYPDSPYYLVTAFNNESGESASTYAAADAAYACNALFPPTQLNAVAGACGGNIDLTWDTGVGATGYYIERYNYADSAAGWQRIATASSTQRSFTDSPGFNTGRAYQIQSFNGNGDVSDYNQYQAYANSSHSCTPPLNPQNIIGNTSAACGGKIDFTWNADPSSGMATEFRLYRYMGWYDLVATTSALATSLTYQQGNQDPATYVMSSYNQLTDEESDYGNVNEYSSSGYYYPGIVQPSVACQVVTQCTDGIDNNGNGKIDWNGGPNGEPADTEFCDNAQDDLEGDPGCTRGDVVKGEGQSFKFYSTSIASTSVGCEAYAKNLTCTQGQWLDQNGNPDNGSTYKYTYCRLNANILEH